MLYLVRKLDESIIINNDVKLKVVEINRKSVKLGFEFSKDSTVYRMETHERIAKQNAEALGLGSDVESVGSANDVVENSNIDSKE